MGVPRKGSRGKTKYQSGRRGPLRVRDQRIVDGRTGAGVSLLKRDWREAQPARSYARLAAWAHEDVWREASTPWAYAVLILTCVCTSTLGAWLRESTLDWATYSGSVEPVERFVSRTAVSTKTT